MRITNIRHPEYTDSSNDYYKWRLTYKGGRAFINAFLKKFSKREVDVDFEARKEISYLPAYAKMAINKLKNTFYSRMSEIVRTGGPDSYRSAITGKAGGVDRFGSSMDVFLGQEVLHELMTMKKVGIFIDRSAELAPLLSSNKGKNPYIYTYPIEDILSWDWGCDDGEYVFYNVLLRDTNYTYDDKTGLTTGESTRYRHLWLSGDDGFVHVQFYVTNDDDKADEDTKVGSEIILPLRRIPFIVPALQESLLADICDYQVGLLNLASSDINYVFNANFPFYTEQYDPMTDSSFMRRNFAGLPEEQGMAARAQQASRADEMEIGAQRGRKYGKGLDRPEFIAPPTEPLMASIAKQSQMKDEIFELIDIAAANAKPQHASAESKQADMSGLESGLAYIGLELQWAEAEIAKIWAMYEKSEPATVIYPSKYTLMSDEQRIDQAKALDGVKNSAPSKTFGKEVAKRISRVMLADKVTDDTLTKIDSEIDSANYSTSDPKVIQIASENGMVDAETGSNALGFDGKNVVPKAQIEHAARLALIAESQAKGAARGNPDGGPIAGKDEQSDDDKKKPLEQKTSPTGRGDA